MGTFMLIPAKKLMIRQAPATVSPLILLDDTDSKVSKMQKNIQNILREWSLSMCHGGAEAIYKI